MIERLGATPNHAGRCHFTLWAPFHESMEVHLYEHDRIVPMLRGPRDVHSVIVDDVPPGSLYRFRFADGSEKPDPASRCQPEGVHGPSCVVALDHEWSDQEWRGHDLEDYVLYELHVGTFTPEGTFDAVLPHLARLRELGVTAIEIMPVAQFPGERNWGYDGVYPFAVQHSYGGVAGLQRLVDACHGNDLAVVLDVVYNHLGPEGNYLGAYGPYFTDVYQTPWGPAINFDGADSDGVRRFFVENALQWIDDFHIDALRLDATHAIIDRSAKPFLEELSEAVAAGAEQRGRRAFLIAESDANDPSLIRPRSAHGLGLDGMWCDDFHHAAHALLTGERDGYYVDFGSIAHLAQAWRRGMSYAGEYSAFRRRRHGRAMDELEPKRIVVCVQNHDQVGNRREGDRMSVLVDFEAEKLAAGLVLLAPFVPLLFMGEEYGERRPFPYFVSHGDAGLVEAVRRGRRAEFASFGWTGNIPDPQAVETFRAAILDHELRREGTHAQLYALHAALLRLRSRIPTSAADRVREHEADQVLEVVRPGRAAMWFSFGDMERRTVAELEAGDWQRVIDSSDERWGGPGSANPARAAGGSVEINLQPRSFVVYILPSQLESADSIADSPTKESSQ